MKGYKMSTMKKLLSINYIDSGETFKRVETNIDHCFATKIATIINLDPEPASLAECKQRLDWEDWKKAMQAELQSLYKRVVFGQVACTPSHIYHV